MHHEEQHQVQEQGEAWFLDQWVTNHIESPHHYDTESVVWRIKPHMHKIPVVEEEFNKSFNEEELEIL